MAKASELCDQKLEAMLLYTLASLFSNYDNKNEIISHRYAERHSGEQSQGSQR